MRKAKDYEKLDLINCLYMEAIYEQTYEEIKEYVNNATIGVIDNYISSSPGYAGRLMLVVWDYPEMYELYLWDKNRELRRIKQDSILATIDN